MKRTRYNRCRTRGLLVLGLAGLLSSCGGSSSNWYDNAREEKAMKEKRMQELIDQGMDPLEASRAWHEEYSIQQTHGKVGILRHDEVKYED